MSKTTLIDKIRNLLDPRPEALVFRKVDSDVYSHDGKLLTRKQCQSMRAKKLIFVSHKSKPKVNEQA